MKAVLALLGCAGRVEVALASVRLPAPSLVALASPGPRAELLLQAVHQVLQAAEMGVDDLDLVVATTGPGSFTGIRNTLACAWGLVQATGLAAHGFSSLLTQAARSAEREVLAVQPARRGWVYAQKFGRRDRWEPEGGVEVVPVEELSHTRLPVVAPPGVALPAGVPLAEVRRAGAEALLELGLQLENPDLASLSPSYVEAFPAARER